MIVFPQFLDDGSIIVTEPAVVQSRSQVVGAAAGTLVHTDDVKSSAVGFGRHPAHVVGICGALKPVEQDEGRGARGVRLPVTEALQLGSRFGGESSCDLKEGCSYRLPRPVARYQGHEMRITEQACGNESVQRSHIRLIIKKCRSLRTVHFLSGRAFSPQGLRVRNR